MVTDEPDRRRSIGVVRLLAILGVVALLIGLGYVLAA
jgi:hypothetical protein